MFLVEVISIKKESINSKQYKPGQVVIFKDSMYEKYIVMLHPLNHS